MADKDQRDREKTSPIHGPRGVALGLLVIGLLAAALWGLSTFGRDGTRVTPGGVEVPTVANSSGPATGQAPPEAR